MAPSDISPRLVSPRKSVSGPVGTPKTEKLTVVTQSQFTLESEVSYPPGYNPNRRRGSVSAESPSRYPKVSALMLYLKLTFSGSIEYCPKISRC